MCGIAGIIDFSGKSILATDLVKMRDSMLHRGPDDFGAVLMSSNGSLSENKIIKFRTVDEISKFGFQIPSFNIGLAHRRLSIIDLSEAGRQPMCNENGSIWITFNGEIYNYKEIRIELEGYNHHFCSNTDTETIIHAYEQWGLECLNRFNGMFAFAIWDQTKKNVILVRDRMGIKPLYYCFSGSKLLFASEIKAILEYPNIPRKVNLEAFNHYLSFHCVPPPATLFEGIYKVPASHYIVLRGQEQLIDLDYWNMFKDRNNESLARSEEDIIDEIAYLFQDATRLCMISDVPFGAFLSGGIDSSLNVAVMDQILSQPVNTFSIGFKDAPAYNELTWSNRVAKLFKTNHHEVIISPQDAISFLPRLVYHQDEPVADPVAVAIYFLSKLAKDNGVTVCQVGEGSDELFCGYPEWLKILSKYSEVDTFSGMIKGIPMLVLSFLASRMFGRAWGTYDQYYSLFHGNEIFWGGAIAFRNYAKKDILSPNISSTIQDSTSDLIARYRMEYKDFCFSPDTLSWMTYIDLRIRLPELLLMRLDKLNMAVALEGRVPFLDHRLVELVLSLSQVKKIKGYENKYILKKTIGSMLPADIMSRPKQGFQLPVQKWYYEYMHKHFSQIVEKFLKETEYFNSRSLKRFLKVKGVPWIIVNFIYWHRMWIDENLSSVDME